MVAYRRLQLPVVRAMNRAAPIVALTVAALYLGACRTVPAPHREAAPPPAVAAPAAATVRYRVDAQRSEVLILVYRDGRLATLGHNHVVAVRQLSGEILLAPDPAHSSWQLDFPVSAMSCDEPQLRAVQGEDFQSKLDDVAIAGTRDHMLGPLLLDAARYPG